MRLMIYPLKAALETLAHSLAGDTLAPPGRPFPDQRPPDIRQQQVRWEPGNSAFHPKSPVASTEIRLTAQTQGSSHTYLDPRFPASLGMWGRSHLKAAGVKWNTVVRRLRPGTWDLRRLAAVLAPGHTTPPATKHKETIRD